LFWMRRVDDKQKDAYWTKILALITPLFDLVYLRLLSADNPLLALDEVGHEYCFKLDLCSLFF